MSASWRFILLLGMVSFFADMAYEGARSIVGSYFVLLGASGTTVGIVAGVGELVGYGFRLISGVWADRSGRYWAIAFGGYVVNLACVPLLALAQTWPAAALLVLGERLGKAIRNPPRDAMLSYASKDVGRGRGIGLHHAMDQAGAFLGPLYVAAMLFAHYSYAHSFAWLALPTVAAIAFLCLARYLYPVPQRLEPAIEAPGHVEYPDSFRYYTAGTCCVAFGFVDYPLIAFHFEKAGVVESLSIPLLYAAAMAASSVMSFGMGHLFDRLGMSVVYAVTAVCALFAPLVFWGGTVAVWLGMVLWGIGFGVQNMLMTAMVARIIAPQRRASAYGLLYACFGLSWFAGSALMGLLYDWSLVLLVACSVLAQWSALPLFYRSRR